MSNNVQEGHGIVRVMIGMVTDGQGNAARQVFACSVVTKLHKECRRGPLEKYQVTICAALARLRPQDYLKRSVASNGFYFDEVCNQTTSCQPVSQDVYMFLATELGMLPRRPVNHDNEAGITLPEQQSQRPDLWDGVPHGQQLSSVQSDDAVS